MEFLVVAGIVGVIVFLVMRNERQHRRELEERQRKEQERQRRQAARELEQAEWRKKWQEEQRQREEEERQRLLSLTAYAKPLGLKFRQLVVQDEYGHLNYDRWERELTYFMRNALDMPKPKKGEFGRAYNNTRAVLDSIARKAAQTLPVMGDISEVMNGIDYEHFIGNKFKEAGWNAEVTKITGDQGADVKVWRDGVDAVVQCKWYQHAVGNKAVQEIVAARTHYAVRNAIVVSKSGYTEAAKELANTNGVCLIHHDEIPDIYERLCASLDRS